MACPLQRLHRSRGLCIRRTLVGFQLRCDPSRRPSASSVRRIRSTRRSAFCFSQANAFSSRFGCRASRLDLPVLSPSAYDPQTAGAHPARNVSPRPSPMCTTASHEVLFPFSVSNRTQRPYGERALRARRLPSPGRFRLCRFDDSDVFFRVRSRAAPHDAPLHSWGSFLRSPLRSAGEAERHLAMTCPSDHSKRSLHDLHCYLRA